MKLLIAKYTLVKCFTTGGIKVLQKHETQNLLRQCLLTDMYTRLKSDRVIHLEKEQWQEGISPLLWDIND